jgi:hypothetical protein
MTQSLEVAPLVTATLLAWYDVIHICSLDNHAFLAMNSVWIGAQWVTI